MTAFVYFHIELDSHDAAFAEGAPSETFMDDGSRGMVPNAQDCYRRPPGWPRDPFASDRRALPNLLSSGPGDGRPAHHWTIIDRHQTR